MNIIAFVLSASCLLAADDIKKDQKDKPDFEMAYRLVDMRNNTPEIVNFECTFSIVVTNGNMLIDVNVKQDVDAEDWHAQFESKDFLIHHIIPGEGETQHNIKFVPKKKETKSPFASAFIVNQAMLDKLSENFEIQDVERINIYIITPPPPKRKLKPRSLQSVRASNPIAGFFI